MHDKSAEIRVLAIGSRAVPDLTPGIFVTVEIPAGAERFDAVVVTAEASECCPEGETARLIKAWCDKSAVLVIAPGLSAEAGAELIAWGVQDVLDSSDAGCLSRAIRFAVARRRLRQTVRLAYATDLSTGLPHQEQFLEYISQLIALRARQPAALVVIVLRTEGWGHWSSRLGAEGSQVLRRKLAVRLRAALRASDVVASIGSDLFGVLLGHVDSADDGLRVVAKLVAALQEPVVVSAQQLQVKVAAGLATWPEHGQEPLDLLMRATAQASSAAVLKSACAEWTMADSSAFVAANDGPSGA